MGQMRATENQYPNLILDSWVLTMLVGMVCSKAALAIGMVGFSLTALYVFLQNRPEDGARLLPFLFPVPIFLITVLSGLNSENTSMWLDFLAKKSPFLILPFAFYATRDHIRKNHLTYLATFVILVSIVSLGVLANYLMNFESTNLAISRGQSLKTPIDHTEYSIFVAFAAITALLLYMEPKRVLRAGSKSTLLLISIFLTLFIHILAVRSGLVIFYGSMALVMGWHWFRQKKFKLLGGMLLALILLPLIAVKTIPSLKEKMNYVQWDLKQYQQGKGLSYSDSERIYSLRAGVSIFKEAPWVGVGIGDLKEKCHNFYEAQVGRILDHYPHNQYLFALAGMGVLGLLVYGFSLLGPLIYFRSQYDPYFICLMMVILLSGLVENTVERTYSIGFYLFFALSSFCHLADTWAHRK